MAVHCSQLDNQPKKYKEWVLRTGHEAVSQGALEGGRSCGLSQGSRAPKLDQAGTKAAFPLVFVLVFPVAAWAKGASFFSCFVKAAPWDEQDPHTALIAGKKANLETLSVEQVLLVPYGGQACVNSGWALALTDVPKHQTTASST